jgi:ketosteroid isomerase-like protein
VGAEENRAATAEAYAAFGRGDIEALIAANAPDTVWEIHSSPASPLNGEHKGHDGVGAFFGIVDSAIEFSKFEMTPIAADGDVVVATGEQDYTVKATGKRVAGPLIHLFTFNSDGKIARFEEWESNTEGAYSS